MKQAQSAFQNGAGSGACFSRGIGIIIAQAWFDKFDIPVAIEIPDKVIQRVSSFVKPVKLNRFGGFFNRVTIFRHDPFIDWLIDSRQVDCRRSSTAVHLQKATGIPDFGGEVPITLKPCCRHFDVTALRCHRRQGESQRVGAILIDKFQRIENIAFGFRHFLAFSVANQRMDIDLTEWHFAIHEVHAHHHHAGNPEKDNIKTGNKNIARIVAF